MLSGEILTLVISLHKVLQKDFQNFCHAGKIPLQFLLIFFIDVSKSENRIFF